jgi:hypothetical protein
MCQSSVKRQVVIVKNSIIYVCNVIKKLYGDFCELTIEKGGAQNFLSGRDSSYGISISMQLESSIPSSADKLPLAAFSVYQSVYQVHRTIDLVFWNASLLPLSEHACVS